MSSSSYVHIAGKVFELVPIPGYVFDGYTYTRVSIGAMYLSTKKLGMVSRSVPNVLASQARYRDAYLTYLKVR